MNNLRNIKEFEETYSKIGSNLGINYFYSVPGIRVFIIVLVRDNLSDVRDKFVIIRKEDLAEFENFVKENGIKEIWILNDEIECNEYIPRVVQIV